MQMAPRKAGQVADLGAQHSERSQLDHLPLWLWTVEPAGFLLDATGFDRQLQALCTWPCVRVLPRLTRADSALQRVITGRHAGWSRGPHCGDFTFCDASPISRWSCMPQEVRVLECLLSNCHWPVGQIISKLQCSNHCMGKPKRIYEKSKAA